MYLVKGAYKFVPEDSPVVGTLTPDAAYKRALSMANARIAKNHYWIGAAYYGFSGVTSFARGYATIPIYTVTHSTSWYSSLSYQPKASYTPLGVIGIQGG